MDPRHDAVGRLRLDVEHASVDGVQRRAGIHAAPRQKSVEDEAEGMDVGPGIHRAERRVDLLGGHPLRRPQPRTDLGGGAAGGIVIDADDRGAQSEVTELHPLPSHSLRLPDGAARLGPVVGGERAVVARHEENVPWLDVAVDDAHGMGRVSRFGEGQDNTGGHRRINGAGMALEPGGEALAAQLLGDVRELVVLPHLMNDDDIRMGNLRGVSRLADKPFLLPRVENDLGAGDLQRLAADELRVDHLEDLGEAPFADLVDDAELPNHQRRWRLRLPRRHHPEEKERVEPFGQFGGDRGVLGDGVARRGKAGELVVDRSQPLDGGVEWRQIAGRPVTWTWTWPILLGRIVWSGGGECHGAVLDAAARTESTSPEVTPHRVERPGKKLPRGIGRAIQLLPNLLPLQIIPDPKAEHCLVIRGELLHRLLDLLDLFHAEHRVGSGGGGDVVQSGFVQALLLG